VQLRFGAPGRFLALGAASFTLNLCITAGLHEVFGVSPEISFAVGLVAAFLMNFGSMRWWVFRGTQRPVVRQLTGFGLASLFFRGLEYAGYIVVYRFAGVPYVAAAVLVLGISTVVKYVVYDSWLFSREKI
jgi:putative flippase GtrA